MKYLTLIIFILHCIAGKAQHHNFDTLPQFTYQNVVSMQGRMGTPAAGIYYSRNFWSGLGYRNYQQLSVGLNFGQFGFVYYNPVETFDFDIRLQHNIRLSLKRLLFFSVDIGYAPLIPLEVIPVSIFDDYINSGYASIGVNGNVQRFFMGIAVGCTVRETKQDLFYTMHTYARFHPHFRFNFGFSFGERKEK